MNKLKISYVLLAAALTFTVSPSSYWQNRNTSKFVLSPDGFGPVKVGMTVRQASRVLGVTLVNESEINDACYYVSSKRGFKGVAFMVTNRRISRIDIDGNEYSTARGARVGDAVSRIKRLYKGMLVVNKHFYTEGQYLTVSIKGGQSAIVFETDDKRKRIIGIQAGKAPEIGYVEGCS